MLSHALSREPQDNYILLREYLFERTIDKFNGFKETIVIFNGFEETIVNFQWFLRRPSPLNVFWQSDHCHQWFFNGFLFFYHRFQWFSMVPDHWSNDAMVSMDRRGLGWTFYTSSIYGLEEFFFILALN